MRILIVDDLEKNLLVLETLLKGYGYQVGKAFNGNIALEKLRTENYDMIISDILMPDMDGYDLCRICKNDMKLKNIFFIFYTATYTDNEDEKFAMKLGADKFLIKPMEPEVFIETISEIIKEIEKNKRIPNEPQISDIESIKVHSDRLFQKLSKKINELEQEVFERKKAEIKLQNSLKEKEILLRELYHRTKNNIQVISSMIRIRARSISDPELTSVLFNLDNKIISMALAHQKLYESKDLSSLNLKEYFVSIVSMVRQSLSMSSGQITFSVVGDDAYVLIDTAVPCGLIVSELVSNAIQHAFPNKNKGMIEINVKLLENNELVIDISDNGVGLPANFDLEKDKHLGLKSIVSLIEHQLQGEIELISNKGLLCHIVFKEEMYKPRV